jgi:hypothetical protein
MKPVITLFLFISVLSGCASAVMEGYVGKDVREAVLDYGPPINAVDLADGQRAFQWKINSSYTTPIQTTTTGNISQSGYNNWFTANTITTGGQTYSSSCIYTLFTKHSPKNDAWIVTGFKKPSLMCE